MNDRGPRPAVRPTERGSAGSNLLLLAAIACAGAAWWFIGRAPADAEVDRDRVVRVERKDLLKAVLATGRVEPLTRAAIMSRASGILKELLVDVGDPVKRGDVLAELDREQLVAQHDQDLADRAAAAARLLAARARLDEARVKLDDPELSYATSQADRSRRLFDEGTLSQTELDDVLLRLETVKYRIAQVRASIPVLQAGAAQAEADLASADAAVERSATALREATIRSPMDGVVLLRDCEVGDGVSSLLTAGGNATPIMTLADLSAMFVEANVDEVDVGRVHEGMRAVITVDAFRDAPFEGRVVRVDPGGTVDDNGIVTFTVKIAVDDPERLLRVDMTANTKLVLDERKGTLTLPHRALARGKEGWSVDRVHAGAAGEAPRVERVPVEIGVSDGLATEILAGLAEGDEVLLPLEEALPARPRR